jgi:hypothetical protein
MKKQSGPLKDILEAEKERIWIYDKLCKFIEAERSVASLYRELEKTETYFALKSELINDNSCTRS